ncbi:Glyco_hydro_17 domain-containing protein [Cephalotus follicularis]|uniref:glucan endo-1,3-beta-D-glucosidase n=1 Tax=Cephalotus follicularis TaxID=3775 RepID=A0A1Q3B3K6_CEPFO|nr:Glyco_hydro_17 domain-containing protein [Cephalotus follicularis]
MHAFPLGGSVIGVCYGMVGDNLPSPVEVIAMYKSFHIGHMRLYEPNPSAFEALRKSGIEVLVGVSNGDIQQLANSYRAAKYWVRKYIRPYWPDVHFRYIAVGNEVIPGYYAQYVLPAMQNLHNALSVGGLWHHIKVSTSVATSVMGISYPPSAGAFSIDTVNYMVPITRYLLSIGAPLLANVYPYFSYIEDPRDISLDYALFTSRNVVVRDGSLAYFNLFDSIVDALHASLEKAGAAKVQVVVSETGWPSAGNGQVASTWNARVYNSYLIRHVLSSGGTPMRPGKPIETYLFAMFNENRKGGAAVEQHWGLFYPNKRPVYPITFSNIVLLDSQII